MLPFADISFGELLLIALEIFFFVIWIWILITILSDLFRDHELSGWAKAAWVLFLVFIPFLTALIYLIARGSGMRDRTIKAQADAKKHFDEYVRDAGPHHPRRRTAQAQRPEGKGRPLGRGVRQGEGQAARLGPPMGSSVRMRRLRPIGRRGGARLLQSAPICKGSCRLLATPHSL